jgi:phospholipid-binding lipoprotein MlaA
MKTQMILILLLSLSLFGCATTATPEQAARIAAEPIITDPFEPFNRAMYGLNKNLDKAIVKPVAEGYRAVTPAQVRTSVGNFFSNIEEVPVFANKVLQAKFKEAGNTLRRFAVNTTLGVLGLFDVATKMGIDREQGDFGQTLYVWGVKSSPYLVLPVLGPTTMRDGLGKLPDYYLGLWDFTSLEVQIAAYALMAVNVRSTYLDQEDILKSAFDEYAFVRDIYIQRRESTLKGQNDITDWDEDLINEHEVY